MIVIIIYILSKNLWDWYLDKIFFRPGLKLVKYQLHWTLLFIFLFYSGEIHQYYKLVFGKSSLNFIFMWNFPLLNCFMW